MITLDNFESCVPYRILVRGEEYYDTDAVSELEETSPGEWTATVEGTDDYNVEISMNGKEVESWYCDCPYDGEICKHVVAALLAIRDNNKRVSRSAFSKMRIVTKEEEVVQPDVDIKQLLSFISPQEISTFIFVARVWQSSYLCKVTNKNDNEKVYKTFTQTYTGKIDSLAGFIIVF